MNTDGQPLREIELTLSMILRVWWLYAWRTFVGAVVVGMVLGFVWGFAISIFGGPTKIIESGGAVIGGIAGLVWSIIGVYMALTKRYREFRIVLVAR